MKRNKLYAVITGDIVKSSKFGIDQREGVLSTLKSSFKAVENILSGTICAPFTIHRGDSFQGVLTTPEAALRIVLIIRASLRYGFEAKDRRKILDARMAIGIGTIDFLPNGRGSEGDGEAFRLSGLTLDQMKKNQRLLIRTPWPEIHPEFDSECALLDALISRWSSEQAQAVIGQIRNLTQEAAARELGISQPAYRQRLLYAGGWAVAAFYSRYEQVIGKFSGQ